MIMGSGTVASADLGYWTSPLMMPSSLVRQYWAWALMVGWAAAPWVNNPVKQGCGACRSCVVPCAKKGI